MDTLVHLMRCSSWLAFLHETLLSSPFLVAFWVSGQEVSAAGLMVWSGTWRCSSLAGDAPWAVKLISDLGSLSATLLLPFLVLMLADWCLRLWFCCLAAAPGGLGFPPMLRISLFLVSRLYLFLL
ncbi:hypothetical protein NL676_007430 [Syzygium grande]|nr:hypothetical protein NL676_007430 [Syzygium grande]